MEEAVNGRLRLLAHSSFFPDLCALLTHFRASASNDLESAIEPVKVYRAQGVISALDLIHAELERLRTAPPEMADKQIHFEE